MQFRFAIDAELERSEGKFASRDELAEKIMAEIGEPSTVEGDEGGTYDVVSWEVSEDDMDALARRNKDVQLLVETVRRHLDDRIIGKRAADALNRLGGVRKVLQS